MVLTTDLIIKIVIVAAAVIGGVAIIGGVIRFVRRTARSAEAQVVKEIVNLVSEKGLDYVNEPEHPRLISNMNKIYRPAIERDFPDFDWGEIKRSVEAAIEEKYSDKSDFEISDTVISRYEKSGASRVIITESAADYRDGEDTRYIAVQTELSFINTKKLDSSGNEEPRALTCPRCGAALSRAANGDIVCEYCETIVVGAKQWQITDIKEK